MNSLLTFGSPFGVTLPNLFGSPIVSYFGLHGLAENVDDDPYKRCVEYQEVNEVKYRHVVE